VLVPSQLKSNKIRDDLEFEWMLCLASTFKAAQCPHPTLAGEARRRPEFPRPKNRKFLGSKGKKAFNGAPKEK